MNLRNTLITTHCLQQFLDFGALQHLVLVVLRHRPSFLLEGHLGLQVPGRPHEVAELLPPGGQHVFVAPGGGTHDSNLYAGDKTRTKRGTKLSNA